MVHPFVDLTPSALADGMAGRVINLNTVPDDLHRQILSELANVSPTAVLNVAHTSKTLRDAALPFIYRKITLDRGPKPSKKRKAYQALVKTLRRDENSKLARHIRSVKVLGNVPAEDLTMLFDKIATSGVLQSLNWETSTHMPRSIFDKIHSTWPNLAIRVVAVERQHAKIAAHQQMDMRLLSSPLLVEFRSEMYTQGYRPNVPCRSDWPRLSRALALGGNVRALQIHSLPDGDGYQGIQVVPDTEPEELPRFDLASGLRLPHLEELSIRTLRHWGPSTYLWDAEHCRMFLDSIDSSQLRKLDFGKDNPETFFSYLAGKLPNLKSLRFGSVEGAMDNAKAFIQSLDELECLDIDQARNGIDDLLPAILQHKTTLRTLILRPTLGSYCSAQYMDLSRLECIAATFPKLQRFGWDAPCDVTVDARHLAVLSSMRLEKCDLYLHIPNKASEYSEELVQDAMGTLSPPPLDKKGSIAAATKIAEVLSDSNQDVLQWLTLHLSRTGYSDRFQPWMMHTRLQLRRNTYNGPARAPKWETRGKMDWYGLPSLEEDLYFEEV